jgi:hypothetical protein
MSFSCSKKYASAVEILLRKESWNCYHPEDFWDAMCQYRYYIRYLWPTLALHGINGDSAGNYHLMGEESTNLQHGQLTIHQHHILPCNTTFRQHEISPTLANITIRQRLALVHHFTCSCTLQISTTFIDPIL